MGLGCFVCGWKKGGWSEDGSRVKRDLKSIRVGWGLKRLVLFFFSPFGMIYWGPTTRRRCAHNTHFCTNRIRAVQGCQGVIGKKKGKHSSQSFVIERFSSSGELRNVF